MLGKLYAFGGADETGKTFSNGYVIDLIELSGWQELPPTPCQIQSSEYCRFVVHDAKAWVFRGEQAIPFFDLEKNVWNLAFTKFRDPKASWSKFFPDRGLISYTAQVYEGKMYIFGGKSRQHDMGRNILMALDFADLTWEILSGDTVATPWNNLPVIRCHTCSWVCDGKLYITLGEVNRQGALFEHKEYGAGNWQLEDLWKYDIATKEWTEEKTRGNVPGMRSMAASTFNPQWNRAIVFGGYSCDIPYFKAGDKQGTMFSFLGDTFMWSAESETWSQVITRGFPSYRSCGNLHFEEVSGRTYLFGGCK